MNDTFFFTIVTASLNNGVTIRKTLDSVKRQSFQDFEHIIIDGKSTDQTMDIIKEYEGTYTLAWISEPDSGISEALNKGVKRAGGTYILVLQADDELLDASVLEKVHSLLGTQAHDVHAFPVMRDHPKLGKRLARPIPFLWWNHFKFIFHHQGCFVKREVFLKIGGFREDLRINMDYDFFYRALAKGFKVRVENFPVTLMGGEGIGSSSESVVCRLNEERLVQISNEQNSFWRLAQKFFRAFYEPYKMLTATRKRGA